MSRDEDDMGYPMPLTQPEIRDKARKRLTGAAVLIWGAVAAAALGVDASAAVVAIVGLCITGILSILYADEP